MVVMSILNYTTSINTEKTAGEIQRKLAKAGAQAVLSEYDDNGIMCAMSFRIIMHGTLISYRLPINVNGVYESLHRDSKVPRKLRTYEQASRVAWRIIKDWIEAQLAIIEAGQAEFSQVFLPYAQNRIGKTLFEVVKEGKFKMLTTELS